MHKAIFDENVRANKAKGMNERDAVMTSMKHSRAKSSEVAKPSPAKEDYPYGLRLDLNDDSLGKLGMSDLPKVGDEMHFHVRGKVESASSSQHSGDGKPRKSVGVQITHMKHLKHGGAVPNDVNGALGDE